MKKMLTLLTAAFAVLASAWAATPVATWTDFSSLSGTSGGTITSAEGNHTLTVRAGCSVDEDGALVIGSSGNAAGADINFSGTTKFTLQLEISGCPDGKILCRALFGGNALCLQPSGTALYQRWTANMANDWNHAEWTASDRQTITVAYDGTDGSSIIGTQTYRNGEPFIAYNNGLKATGTNVSSLGIGYQYGTEKVATGMKVYAIRVFNMRLTNDEVKSAYEDTIKIGDVTLATTAGASNGVSTFSGDTFILKVPATEELPAGSVVRLSKLVFGMNSSNDASQMAKYVRIGSKTSKIANGTGNQVTNVKRQPYNCLLQTYDFSAANVKLVVGNEYPLTFLSDAHGTIMDGTRWHMRQNADGFITQSKTSTSYRIYAELEGALVAKPENGIVVFDGRLPTTEECATFKSSDWKGTVWLKNITAATANAAYWQMPLGEYGNANSTIRLTGCEGYLNTATVASTIELIDEGSKPAWKFTAGGKSYVTTINKLIGNGTFENAYANLHRIKFVDVSGFEGSINAHQKYIEIGSGDNNSTQGKILVDADKTLLVAERKTMTANAGVEVRGTLKGTGTIAGALTMADGSTLDLSEGLVTVTGEVSSGTGTVNVKLTSAEVSGAIPVLKLAEDNPMSAGAILPCSANPTYNGEAVVAALKFMVGADGTTLVLSPVGEGAEIEVAVKESRKQLNNVAVNGFTYKLTGIGGVLANTLAINETGVLEFDPIKTPMKIAAKPTFAEGAKIKLASAYNECTLGKFKLFTWVGDSLGLTAEQLKELVDVGERECTVEDVEAPAENVGMRQLILKIGNYDTEAKEIRIMPLGDSITDGTSKNAAYECNPNYRVALMQKLAARGYKPMTSGLRECAFNNRYSTDASGVIAPSEYRWHSGVSGARVRTNYRADRGVNGGWREAIETTLDAAGDIDIITFKIGTNDAGDDKNTVFAGWTNVVWRILNARPKVKIVVTSILNMNGNDVWESGYNALIKAQVEKTEGEGVFPAGRVFYVNLHDACPRSTDGISNFTDAYHPNWIGHDRTSDEWVGGVEKAIMAMTFPTDEHTFKKNANVGAVNNVPEAYRKDYIQLAKKALPKKAQGEAMQNTAAVYDMMAEGVSADTKLDRVAYYVELKNKKTGHVRYVWTSMDAFGDKTLASVGMPTSYAKWGEVTNLRVVSNDTGVRTTGPDAEGIKGRLQFTYGGVDVGGSVVGAPTQLAKWDWNDAIKGTEESPNGSYGTMQVYRVFDKPEADQNVAETLFAYNRWADASTSTTTEIGIGNFAMHGAWAGGDTSNGSLNYMYTSGYETVDASAYELMNLEIWGLPESTGPKTIDDITEDNVMSVVPESVQSADAAKLASWIKETSGITTIAGLSSINANCFLLGVANQAADPEFLIEADDLSAVLTGEFAAIEAKYPNATVSREDVTEKVCGAGAANTRLYRLKLQFR